MRRLILGLLIVVTLAPGFSAALTTSACESCAGAPGCESKREACVAECRARLFSVDPRRPDCIASCVSTAVQCARSVESFCRAGNCCQ